VNRKPSKGLGCALLTVPSKENMLLISNNGHVDVGLKNTTPTFYANIS
jgi:hypothetical protein